MIIKDSAFQILANIINGILLFIFIVFLTRNLGVEEFGRYQFAVTFGLIISLFQDFGFKSLIFREVSHPTKEIKMDNSKIFSTAIFQNIFFTILVLIILQFFNNKNLLLLSTLLFYLYVNFLFFSFFLKGQGNFVQEAKFNVIFKFATIFPVLIFIPFIRLNSEIVFILSIIGSLICLLYFFNFLKLDIKFKNFSINLYKYTYSFFLIDFFTQLYFRSDIFILTYLKGYKENGFYSANCRIIEGILFLISPIIFIFFQRLRKNIKEIEKFKSFFKIYMFFTFMLALFSLLLIFYSNFILEKFYGKDFIYGVVSLKILLLALFFMIINFLLTQTLISLNQENFYSKLAITLFIINISLNLILIPKYSLIGASISKLVIEIILTFLIFVKLKKLEII